jgi:hypothetical protein
MLAALRTKNMSPLVQRQRPGPGRPDPADQHWSMLLFQSCSAGVAAIFVGILAVLAMVGVYLIIVWPLTFWDIHVSAQAYESWASTVLWSVFGGGTLAGYWCFSGRAFRGKSKSRTQAVTAKSRR